MLVLSRKTGDRILIGDDIAVTIVRVAQGTVRIGIEAPSGVAIVREEIQKTFSEVSAVNTVENDFSESSRNEAVPL
ncbi:MAG: carbon storage regulator [Thermoguttaceae bacterium]|nr:carbon storage regulator [Thermoguttaceae bacterium]MBP3693476.1 carbon storage regulator [Thermoguttaceae bacterium]